MSKTSTGTHSKRTVSVILLAPIGDAELGSFPTGAEYPCDEGTAQRLVARGLAKAKEVKLPLEPPVKAKPEAKAKPTRQVVKKPAAKTK